MGEAFAYSFYGMQLYLNNYFIQIVHIAVYIEFGGVRKILNREMYYELRTFTLD